MGTPTHGLWQTIDLATRDPTKTRAYDLLGRSGAGQYPYHQPSPFTMTSTDLLNQAWLEQITYQMNYMSYAEQAKHLSGPIGLLKTYLTRGSHEISDDATNIFGGRGLTATGMGRVIEQFQRTYKFDAILGGAEEVMNDLGVRQAMRFMPNAKL